MKYLNEWRNEINKKVSNYINYCINKRNCIDVLDIGPENSTSSIIKTNLPHCKTLDQRPDISSDYFFDLCDSKAVIDNKCIEKFDIIFCLEVLEHTKTPWIAADNLVSMLKPGAFLCVSVPAFFGWHPHNNGNEPCLYGDYWRFLPGHIKPLFPKLNLLDKSILLLDDQAVGMNYLLEKT